MMITPHTTVTSTRSRQKGKLRSLLSKPKIEEVAVAERIALSHRRKHYKFSSHGLLSAVLLLLGACSVYATKMPCPHKALKIKDEDCKECCNVCSGCPMTKMLPTLSMKILYQFTLIEVERYIKGNLEAAITGQLDNGNNEQNKIENDERVARLKEKCLKNLPVLLEKYFPKIAGVLLHHIRKIIDSPKLKNILHNLMDRLQDTYGEKIVACANWINDNRYGVTNRTSLGRAVRAQLDCAASMAVSCITTVKNLFSGKKPAAEEKKIEPKKLSNDPETRAVMVIMLAMFDKVEETLKGKIVIPYTLKFILQAVNNDSILKNPARALISWACKRFVGVENLDFVKFIKDKITELVGKLKKQNDLMQTIQTLENISKERPGDKSRMDAAKVLVEAKLASGQNPEDLNQMIAKANFRITNPCQCIPVPLTIVEALLNDVEFDLPANIIEKVKANFLKSETLKLLQLDTLHEGEKHIKTILDDVLGVDARDIILEFFSQHIKDIILDLAHLLEKSAKDELNGISDFTDLLDLKINMKNATGKMKLRIAKWLGLNKAVRGNITGMIKEKIEEYSDKMEKWVATAKGDDWLKLIKGTPTFFKRMEESEKLDNRLRRQDGFEPLSCGECDGAGVLRRPVNQKDPKGLEILVWQNHESKDNWVQATLVTPPKRPSDLVTVRYENDEEKYFEEKVDSDRTVVVKKCLKCNGKGYSESDMYANAVYKGLSALTEAQEPISAVKFTSDEKVSEAPIDEVIHAHPFAYMGNSTSYGLGIGSPTITEFNNKDSGITISDPESKTSQPGPPPSPRKARVSEEKITTRTTRVVETPLHAVGKPKRPWKRATVTRRGAARRKAGPAPSKKKEIESTSNESSRRRLGRAGRRTSSSEHRRLAAARADPKQRLHLTYEEMIGQGSQRIPVGLQWILDEIDAAEQ